MLLKNKSVPTSFPEVASRMHHQNLHACLTWLIVRLQPSVQCSLCHDTPRTGLDFTLWTVGTKHFHYAMFYRREYKTGADHRLFAIPSYLCHKEPCLYSQSLPHPFHPGFPVLSTLCWANPPLSCNLIIPTGGIHLYHPFFSKGTLSQSKSSSILWNFSRAHCLISVKSFSPCGQIAQRQHDPPGLSGIFNSSN